MIDQEQALTWLHMSALRSRVYIYINDIWQILSCTWGGDVTLQVSTRVALWLLQQKGNDGRLKKKVRKLYDCHSFLSYYYI